MGRGGGLRSSDGQGGLSLIWSDAGRDFHFIHAHPQLFHNGGAAAALNPGVAAPTRLPIYSLARGYGPESAG
jgi:hypothetical protein